MRSAAFRAATTTAVLLCLASVAAAQEGADMVISGKLNHNGVLDVADQPASTVGLSAARYIFEVPPSLVGVVQPLDQDLVESLCRDLEGCRITVQAVNWDDFNAPGGVMSKTSRLFLSDSSSPDGGIPFRFDEVLSLWGADNDNQLDVFVMSDCRFTDGESSTGTNGYSDDVVGFGLLNCHNESLGCSLSDSTTTCRVVLED